MSRPTTRLRELLDGPPFLAVECLGAATAQEVQRAGVPATYAGGSGLGHLLLGIPDHGLITTTEMIDFAAAITAAVDIPLLVDGDQGGETALNTRRTIGLLERAGVAGVHIEDTVNPKHMAEGDALVPIAQMQVRIEAAVAGRRDPDFVLIARSDVFFNGGGLDEAVARGIAFAEAGADAYMPIQMRPDDIPVLRDAVPVPLVDINVPAAVQQRTGLPVNIHTGPALAHALRAHRAWIQEVLDTGGTDFAALLPEYATRKVVTGEETVWLPLSRQWAGVRASRSAAR